MAIKIINFLAFWGLAVALFVLVVNFGAERSGRAVIFMGWGLIIFWVMLCGFLMYRYRERAKLFLEKININQKLKFVLFATFLVLIEEAIATLMTNLVVFFGANTGTAYITASSNYFDVIFFHSAVLFVPMFVAWAFLLDRYEFDPKWVFILFGITGTFLEVLFGGAQQFLAIGMWSFVYGLMVYLPAYSFSPSKVRRNPAWRHYLLALFFPVVFSMPVAFVVNTIHPEVVHFEKCIIHSGCLRN